MSRMPVICATAAITSGSWKANSASWISGFMRSSALEVYLRSRKLESRRISPTGGNASWMHCASSSGSRPSSTAKRVWPIPGRTNCARSSDARARSFSATTRPSSFSEGDFSIRALLYQTPDRVPGGARRLVPVVAQRAARRRLAELRARACVAEQPEQETGEVLGLARIEVQHRVAAELGHGRAIRADHRLAGGHRLEERIRAVLGFGSEDADQRMVVRGRKLRVRLAAGRDHAVLQPERGDLVAHQSPIVVVVGPEQ